ncbi:TIGR04211 family SH3 domain-containing protein [Desulfuromonas sp. TF]|uniref:TIGR04211 family SH3 domain-containing protein n=1 Tax=Desulfuromonas sp. TF TaxID=1232410 RepID=UPI0003F83084|nr:TIGR04211 family SH3 domain-containing protein [Desulfuromonas sp. TF]
MKTAIGIVCLFVLVLASALPVAADTRFVSDRLIITVRDGKGPGAAPLTTLPTDEPVEVLEEDAQFLKIRTKEGLVGFVQAQYITKETPKPIIIERLEKEVDRLKGRMEELKAAQSPQAQELESLRERAQSLEKTLAETQSELRSALEKYNTLAENSGRVVEVTAERDLLQEENQRLAAELATLEEDNTQLLRRGMIEWFLAGAGVFVVGWIIGKVSRKKRRF